MIRQLSWAAWGLLVVPGFLFAAEKEPSKSGEKPDGREIFERVWTANDARSHGGDGLGPVFNANSCIVCHDQGGPGGAGDLTKNVNLLSASLPALPVKPEPGVPVDKQANPEAIRAAFEAGLAQAKQNRATSRKLLVERFHPEFDKSDTVVLHATGTDETAHAAWLSRTNVRGGGITDFISGSALGVPPNGTDFTRIAGGGMGFQQIGGFGNPLLFNPVDPNSFPVLAEMTAKINTLRGQRNTNHSTATVIEGGAALRTSQRQTTALWGAGLIDGIPDEAIEAIAREQHDAKGRISGRPHRLAEGKIGRFGWKGQKASLYDFTMAACANELGLEVPGAHQATAAYDPKHEPKGLDLNDAEVDALVEYLAKLPAPRQMRKTDDETVAKQLASGREVFASVGCAECHREQVGEVVGLYSDLLLHDLGADLGAVGSYGVPQTPEPDPADVPVAGVKGKPVPVGPTSREWRTAPLWGVGSSAPYLHDGRAKTLEQAIAFHGGEAAESRLRVMLLSPTEKESLLAFLDSLVAPILVAQGK